MRVATRNARLRLALLAVCAHRRGHGREPTERELAAALGIGATTAWARLRQLRRSGLLEAAPSRCRGGYKIHRWGLGDACMRCGAPRPEEHAPVAPCTAGLRTNHRYGPGGACKHCGRPRATPAGG